jgi:hypothetical protein
MRIGCGDTAKHHPHTIILEMRQTTINDLRNVPTIEHDLVRKESNITHKVQTSYVLHESRSETRKRSAEHQTREAGCQEFWREVTPRGGQPDVLSSPTMLAGA